MVLFILNNNREFRLKIWILSIKSFISLFFRKKEKQKKLAAADKSAKILSFSLDKNKLASLKQYFCLNRLTTKFLNAISPKRQGFPQIIKIQFKTKICWLLSVVIKTTLTAVLECSKSEVSCHKKSRYYRTVCRWCRKSRLARILAVTLSLFLYARRHFPDLRNAWHKSKTETL